MQTAFAPRSSGEQWRIRLFATRNYKQLSQTDKLPSSRKPRVAIFRADLTQVPAPLFLLGAPRGIHGIIRCGSEAFTRDYAGRKVKGDAEMRQVQGLLQAKDLIAAISTNPDTSPFCFFGCGNPIQNIGCGVFFGSLRQFRTGAQEGNRRSLPYDSLIFSLDGRPRIDEVIFTADDQRGCCSLMINGLDCSADVTLAITGQRLLRSDSIVDPYSDPVAARNFADFRHLINFPWVNICDWESGSPLLDAAGNPVKRDFGLDQLYEPGGSPHARFDQALKGHPVELLLEVTEPTGRAYRVMPDDLKAALAEKSCQACHSLEELTERSAATASSRSSSGLYYLDESKKIIHIVFRHSPYPHHCVATRRDEPFVIYHVLIGGWSNNAGTNPLDLALDLRDAGFSDALLLDNGGDVAFWLRRAGGNEPPDPNGAGAVIPSSLGRECWTGLMAYTSPTGNTLEASGQRFAVCELVVDMKMHAELTL